jgi:hypothetical protein
MTRFTARVSNIGGERPLAMHVTPRLHHGKYIHATYNLSRHSYEFMNELMSNTITQQSKQTGRTPHDHKSEKGQSCTTSLCLPRPSLNINRSDLPCLGLSLSKEVLDRSRYLKDLIRIAPFKNLDSFANWSSDLTSPRDSNVEIAEQLPDSFSPAPPVH